MAQESSGPRQQQVRLQLTTKDQEILFPESIGPILVPSSLRRYTLSTLVNDILGRSGTGPDAESPIVPLEFLINGSYLRTSLDEFLTNHGISAETTLSVEYVRALVPPSYIASFEHDDWVSCVDVLPTSSPASTTPRILSGSYDSYLRIWNPASEILATSPSASEGGHTSSILSAQFISPTQVVSTGLDRTIRVWKYTETQDNLSAKLTPHLELSGHTASVDHVSAHAQSSRILSASSDHHVGFWSTKKSEGPTPTNQLSSNLKSSKRRKINRSVTIPERGPLALLPGHTAGVSSAHFDAKDYTVGYSASWDHTIRTWDLVTSTSVDTRTTPAALVSLLHLPALSLLAAGSTARDIRLVDPRDSATSVSVMTLRGHTNAVTALDREPGSEHGLVSASHDGTCRVWDLRSRRSSSGKGGVEGESVYTIERESRKSKGRSVGGEGVKVFGVRWDKEVGIVSASEDKWLQINRGAGLGMTRTE